MVLPIVMMVNAQVFQATIEIRSFWSSGNTPSPICNETIILSPQYIHTNGKMATSNFYKNTSNFSDNSYSGIPQQFL